MVNRIPPILLGIITLFHASNPPLSRAAFSPVIQSDTRSESAPSDYSSGQTPPSTKPAGSGPSTGDIRLLAANDPQNSLWITSLPPVAIQDKQKTTKDYLFEWGAWAFNLLLVIVGTLQLLMLRHTRQEMSLQREVMSLQREEMSRQRELMFLQYRSNVDSTRAKLFAIFPPEKPSFIPSPPVEDSVEVHGLAVRIANNGLTDAEAAPCPI